MARRPTPKRAWRDGASDVERDRGRGRGLATRGPDAVDRRPGDVDGDVHDPDRFSDDDLEVEDDDDLREDAAALLGIPVVDIDVDGEDADDIDTPTQSGKKSDVWSYFDEVKDGEGPTTVRIEAICKHCSTEYSAIPANGTTHLRRHMKNV
jgi:hypothetical protein